MCDVSLVFCSVLAADFEFDPSAPAGSKEWGIFLTVLLLFTCILGTDAEAPCGTTASPLTTLNRINRIISIISVAKGGRSHADVSITVISFCGLRAPGICC